MRVAIYSGAIPSTTFIDNLVVGLAEKDVTIYLFGRITKKCHYNNNNIKIYQTYNNGLIEFVHCVYNAIKLLVCHPKRFCVLARHIGNSGSVSSLNLWSRYLSVVNHLPDIFHVQWTKSASDWTFLKQFGVKLILSFRGTHVNVSPICDSSLAELYRQSFHYYDAFHCVSTAMKTEGMKYGDIESKSFIIYPAITEQLIERANRTYKTDNLNILSVGRTHWLKGYNVAIEAMAILKTKSMDFHYTIVASGDKEELMYEINQLNLAEYVTIVDNLPQSEVFELYAKSDLLLLPSFEEGVANVVLEAMALGTPVISTYCGGMKEVINHGENGLIVPIRNAEAIANAIQHFSTLSTEEIISITDNAKNTIREKHLLNYQVEKMIELYKTVLYE